jgi:hypothetical protein
MLKPGDKVTYRGQTRIVTDDYGPTFYPATPSTTTPW